VYFLQKLTLDCSEQVYGIFRNKEDPYFFWQLGNIMQRRCRCHNSLYRRVYFGVNVQVAPKTKQYWPSISRPLGPPSPENMFRTYDGASTCLSCWRSIWSATTFFLLC
jgi:hypothetical protein